MDSQVLLDTTSSQEEKQTQARASSEPLPAFGDCDMDNKCMEHGVIQQRLLTIDETLERHGEKLDKIQESVADIRVQLAKLVAGATAIIGLIQAAIQFFS